jgi:N-acetylglucosaminyldiphosphoundecaprenol N-acetyl-beta-D-mannosaminyltransferase
MSSRTYHPSPAQSKVHGKFILGCFINADSWDHAINRIHRWTAARESRYVCICNVHSLVTARQDKVFHRALINADMATPDGMPIAWMLRQMGFPNQERINGPDLMWNYCQLAERMKEPIFLYGSTPKTLDAIQHKLLDSFPKLLISGTYSPPFRTLTSQEDTEIIDIINNSDARVVFVSLGCPKQELWMAQHRGKINAVMIGVGAAFDYHAGTIKRAPLWMQHHGLEWLHRLYSEPRRLWKRYMVTNSIFIVAAGWQLIAHKLKMSSI